MRYITIPAKRIFYSLLLILCLGACETLGCRTENRDPSPQREKIRSPAVAGQWYPNSAVELREAIERYLGQASTIAALADIYGVVAPHAGYAYSGAVAGAAYKQVQGKQYDSVIIIGPSHREYFNGISVYDGDGFKTPLGIARIDKELAERIISQDARITFSEAGHRAEHSLEAQVPFIQVVLPDAQIVPIAMCDYSWENCTALADAITKAVGTKKVLLVASSDLYHGESYRDCKESDERTLAKIVEMNPKSLCDGLHDRYSACGGGPIVVIEYAAKNLGADVAHLVKRTNSGDVSGQRDGYVVGYGAVVIASRENGTEHTDAEGTADQGKRTYSPLPEHVQQELLHIARQAITSYLEHGIIPVVEPKYEIMNERRGVFVTLTEFGNLRGCIGYHESDVPLYKLVAQVAVAAAVNDRRFPPVSWEEVNDLHIKISVYLTNVYKIKSIDEFAMGHHGIIMYKNGRGATYLPEVPLEAGWSTKEEELRSLCLKAGLPSDAWKSGAEFYVYETQVFGEMK